MCWLSDLYFFLDLHTQKSNSALDMSLECFNWHHNSNTSKTTFCPEAKTALLLVFFILVTGTIHPVAQSQSLRVIFDSFLFLLQISNLLASSTSLTFNIAPWFWPPFMTFIAIILAQATIFSLNYSDTLSSIFSPFSFWLSSPNPHPITIQSPHNNQGDLFKI